MRRVAEWLKAGLITGVWPTPPGLESQRVASDEMGGCGRCRPLLVSTEGKNLRVLHANPILRRFRANSSCFQNGKSCYRASGKPRDEHRSMTLQSYVSL